PQCKTLDRAPNSCGKTGVCHLEESQLEFTLGAV
ncbi:unnamed protein product, partial [Allacma fusca]